MAAAELGLDFATAPTQVLVPMYGTEFTAPPISRPGTAKTPQFAAGTFP
jgi:hypothetical protein